MKTATAKVMTKQEKARLREEYWQECVRKFDASDPRCYAKQVLGVKRYASAEEIRSAYRALVKVHHPDKGGNRAKFEQVQEAYETLSKGDAWTTQS